MATQTSKLGLRKPDTTDVVDVTTDISNNMQTIDDKLPEHKVVRKSASETVTNSVVLQNDDALLFAVAANTVWAFEFYIICQHFDDGGDIKFGITSPAGSTRSAIIVGGDLGSITAGEGVMREYPNNAFGNLLTNGVDLEDERSVVLIKGVAIIGGTAGNVTLQWAQNGATLTGTTVHAGSYLIAHRLA
jgi:hypothetical protein